MDEADIDIAAPLPEAPTGYQYMRSMAKLMAAWTASWGRWSPHRWMDCRLRATNQIRRVAKMSSQRALGPNAHRSTNMPPIDTPMKMWAMSTSRPTN